MLRQFQAFLASSPCAASATSYHFASSASPPWHNVFSQFVPVVNSVFSVLASGSNFAVKPTRLRRAAYFRSLDALLCAQISASNKTVFFLKSNLKFLRGTPWRNILKNWLFLATAIISEVIATSALKSSEGFTRLVPSFIVVAGYAAAFYFLSLTLKSIPVGIAYAVWSGLGIVLVTAIAWVLHGQKLDMWGFVGVGFIISGVAVLNLLSKASVH